MRLQGSMDAGNKSIFNSVSSNIQITVFLNNCTLAIKKNLLMSGYSGLEIGLIILDTFKCMNHFIRGGF